MYRYHKEKFVCRMRVYTHNHPHRHTQQTENPTFLPHIKMTWYDCSRGYMYEKHNSSPGNITKMY